MLAACAPHVRWADVFCDRGAFDADEARVVLTAAAAAGLGLRVHANQLEHGPGVGLAVELGAADAINVAVAAPFVPALNDLNLELCTLAQAVTVSGGDVDSSIEDFRKAATTLLNG